MVFHLLTWLLFPIGMFPWIMSAGALIFFAPDWPQRLLAALRRRFGVASADAPDRTEPSSPAAFPPDLALPRRRGRAAARCSGASGGAAAPLGLSWQRALERGRLPLCVADYADRKTGQVHFRVTDPSTGEEWLAYPEEYFVPLQVERMAYQPDMILATAHLIAADANRRGRSVEVRADAYVAFNGRPAARFIDPAVDLARVVPGLGPSTWVLPAPAADR